MNTVLDRLFKIIGILLGALLALNIAISIVSRIQRAVDGDTWNYSSYDETAREVLREELGICTRDLADCRSSAKKNVGE